MSDPNAWKPIGQVVIGHDHKPYLMSEGRTYARTGDGGWYSISLTQPFMVGCHICSPDEAALYGVIDGEICKGGIPSRAPSPSLDGWMHEAFPAAQQAAKGWRCWDRTESLNTEDRIVDGAAWAILHAIAEGKIQGATCPLTSHKPACL